MLDPVAAYDRIGPVFARIAEKRRAYLDSIDRLVISGIPTGSRSMLDVGSGDGQRARRIAQARDIADLVLVEPSAAMQRSETRFRTMRAEELHLIEGRVRRHHVSLECPRTHLSHLGPPGGPPSVCTSGVSARPDLRGRASPLQCAPLRCDSNRPPLSARSPEVERHEWRCRGALGMPGRCTAQREGTSLLTGSFVLSPRQPA